jgi:hypothetical protein
VIDFENGAHLFVYEALQGVRNSRVGDRVQLCLIATAKDCPPGDERGRVYKGTNLRTGESWMGPDTLLRNCSGA